MQNGYPTSVNIVAGEHCLTVKLIWFLAIDSRSTLHNSFLRAVTFMHLCITEARCGQLAV